jgi:integrase
MMKHKRTNFNRNSGGFLPREEVRRLLLAVRLTRDRTALLAAYLHGLRVSELIGLKVEDVRDGHVAIQRLKGGERNVHALVSSPDPVFDEATLLPAQLVGKAPTDPIFGEYRVYWDRIIKDAAVKAGLPLRNGRMHILRHSAAMEMLRNDAKLPAIQKRLGHKSIASTGRYLHVTDDEASDAVAKIFG